MSSRVSRVYRAGVGTFGQPPTNAQDAMLRAMAAMIAEATSIIKPTKAAKKKEADLPLLAFGPGEFYEIVKDRVPHVIGCEPYNARWFGQLGRKLRDTSGLKREDMELFVGWVESGGLDFFNSCTFAHVIKHWDGWIVKARSGTVSKTGMSAEEYL